MESQIVIGVPVVVLLAILVLFGVTWMFHHHYWKPVIGGLLFVIGIAFLVMFGWVAPHRMEISRQSEALQMDEIKRSEEMRRADEQQLAQAHSKQSVDRQPSGADGPPATGHKESSSDPERVDSGHGTISSEIGSAKTAASPPSGDSAGKSADAGTPTSDARPAWVDWPLGLKQAGKGFEATAASGLYSTRAECKRAIIQPVNDLATEYVSENVPEAADQGLALDRDYIWSKLVKTEYWETVDKAFGAETHPMSQLHVLLAFDSQVGRDLADQAHQALVGSRLKDAAGVTACSLALLGGVYLLLKRGTSPRTPRAEQVA
jgi:hypothetical protein